MSKLVKLAQLLRTGAPITDRFMHSILDDSLLPNSIKKKAILYYRGDKRLSVSKFIDAISQTRKRRVQKGGVWKIGVKNNEGEGYKVTTYDDDHAIEIEVVQRPDIQVFAPAGLQELHLGSEILGKDIGSGNFATVYEIRGDNQHVFKMFNPAVLAGIETNLTEFLKTHHGIATVFPRQVIFEDIYTSARERIGRGYKMIKCDQSLKKTLDTGIDISSYVTKTLDKLTDTDFVHGDIKLDNIMLQGATVHISDWDGVYMYDENLSTGPPECVCFSPATAHPYYLWYVAMFKEKTDLTADTFTRLPLTTDIADVWNKLLGNSSTAEMIKSIVNNEIYEGGFAAYANQPQNFKNPSWHRRMLKICDRYSLEMSLLLCAIRDDTDQSTESMSQGAQIMIMSNSFQDGSGGRQKSIWGGADSLHAFTNPPPMEAEQARAEAKAKSILSIVEKYKKDKRIIKNKLDELMSTHMFMPNKL
jgi:hypothetical protein